MELGILPLNGENSAFFLSMVFAVLSGHIPVSTQDLSERPGAFGTTSSATVSDIFNSSSQWWLQTSTAIVFDLADVADPDSFCGGYELGIFPLK